jgi:hypothetical protein
MSERSAVTTMRIVVGLWYIGVRSAADIVKTACDLLVAGFDGPALRELAAAPPHLTDSEVSDLLEPALRDVGLPCHRPDSSAARFEALAAMASLTLSNAATPSALAISAWWYFDEDDEFARPLTQFHDFYASGSHSDTAREEIDAKVMAEANRIVADMERNTPGP